MYNTVIRPVSTFFLFFFPKIRMSRNGTVCTNTVWDYALIFLLSKAESCV